MSRCPKGKTSVVVECGARTRYPEREETEPGICNRKKAFCVGPGEQPPRWRCTDHDKPYVLGRIASPRTGDAACFENDITFVADAIEYLPDGGSQDGGPRVRWRKPFVASGGVWTTRFDQRTQQTVAMYDEDRKSTRLNSSHRL